MLLYSVVNAQKYITILMNIDVFISYLLELFDLVYN